MLLLLSILSYLLDFLLLKVILESLDLSVATTLPFLHLEDEDLSFEKILLFLLLMLLFLLLLLLLLSLSMSLRTLLELLLLEILGGMLLVL